MPSKANRAQVYDSLQAYLKERPRRYADCVDLIVRAHKLKDRQAKNIIRDALNRGIVFRHSKYRTYVDRPERPIGALPAKGLFYRDSVEYLREVSDTSVQSLSRMVDELKEALSGFNVARLRDRHLQDIRDFLGEFEAAFRPWPFVDADRIYHLPAGLSKHPAFIALREHLGDDAELFRLWKKLAAISPASGPTEQGWVALVGNLLTEARRLKIAISYPGECQVCKFAENQSGTSRLFRSI